VNRPDNPVTKSPPVQISLTTLLTSTEAGPPQDGSLGMRGGRPPGSDAARRAAIRRGERVRVLLRTAQPALRSSPPLRLTATRCQADGGMAGKRQLDAGSEDPHQPSQSARASFLIRQRGNLAVSLVFVDTLPSPQAGKGNTVVSSARKRPSGLQATESTETSLASRGMPSGTGCLGLARFHRQIFPPSSPLMSVSLPEQNASEKTALS
jgi:hypothetical protein